MVDRALESIKCLNSLMGHLDRFYNSIGVIESGQKLQRLPKQHKTLMVIYAYLRDFALNCSTEWEHNDLANLLQNRRISLSKTLPNIFPPIASSQKKPKVTSQSLPTVQDPNESNIPTYYAQVDQDELTKFAESLNDDKDEVRKTKKINKQTSSAKEMEFEHLSACEGGLFNDELTEQDIEEFAESIKSSPQSHGSMIRRQKLPKTIKNNKSTRKSIVTISTVTDYWDNTHVNIETAFDNRQSSNVIITNGGTGSFKIENSMPSHLLGHKNMRDENKKKRKTGRSEYFP